MEIVGAAVGRLFNITLDAIYRFAAAVLFVATVVAWGDVPRSIEGGTPLSVLSAFISWLGIPAGGIDGAAAWISARQDALATAAFVLAGLAVLVTSAGPRASRAGSTVLLGIALCAQTEVHGGDVAAGIAALGILLAFASTSGADDALSRWERVTNVSVGILTALIAVVGPFAWVLAGEPRPQVPGSSVLDPIHVTIASKPGLTGAIRRTHASADV